MANFDLSPRDRHALKWHLNGVRVNDRVEGRRLDRIWAALRLDDVATTQDVPPEKISAVTTAYPLGDEERDQLITWLDTPRLGVMSRLLSAIDRMLLKSRDGEADAAK